MYTYISEQGKQETITTIEKAKSVIIATATSWELSQEELMTNKPLTDIARIFNIDLNELSINPRDDPNDFVYTYSFK